MAVPAWLSEQATMGTTVAAAVVLLVLSVLLASGVVMLLPADYFSRSRRNALTPSPRNSLLWIVIMVAKNALGFALLAAGVLMLFLPGQGVLTIVVGLLLMNFPGKYRLERWAVTRPGVLSLLNRCRLSLGKPPFEL